MGGSRCPIVHNSVSTVPVHSRVEQAQLGRAAQHAVDEEAIEDRAAEREGLAVPPDELVGNGAAEPVASTFTIEAQQVPSVELGLADPQLADAAVYQWLIHWLFLSFDLLQNREANARPSNHQESLVGPLIGR